MQPSKNKIDSRRRRNAKFWHLSHTPANRNECPCRIFLDKSHKYQHFVSKPRKSQIQICHPYKGGESTGCLVFLSLQCLIGYAWLCFVFIFSPSAFFATWFRSLTSRPACISFVQASEDKAKWNLPNHKTCWAPKTYIGEIFASLPHFSKRSKASENFGNTLDGPLTMSSTTFFSAFPKISENIAGPGHICENVSNSIYGVLQWVEPAFPLPGFADRSSVECQRLLDLGWTKMALAHVTWRATGDIGLPQNLWFVVNFPIQMVVKWCWQCQFRVVLRAAWGDFEQVPPTSNSLVPPTSNSLCRQRLFVSSGLNHKHQIEVQSLYILWN